jgi:4-amino-4-deoxy-L-arabinose transferase
MIHLQDQQFWHYFFWIEHIKRFMSANAPHPEPFWYFIPIMAGGALPWVILLPAATPGLKGRHPEDPLVRFALCWLLFPFLFFSASHGKLGTYILPCFPPFVALVTVGLVRSLREGKTFRFNIAVSFFAILITLGAVILSLSQTTDLLASKIYGATESRKWALIVAGLLTGSVLSALSVRSLDYKRKLMLYCSAPLLLMFSAHLVVPDQAREGKMPGELVLRNSERISSDTILVSDKYLALTVCWIYKRNDVYIWGDGGELAWGLSYDETEHRLLTPDKLKKLARKKSGKNRLIYVTFLEEYTRYKDHLPPPTYMDTYGLFVFIEF